MREDGSVGEEVDEEILLAGFHCFEDLALIYL